VNPPAVYTPGHNEAVTAFMARRCAETHAAFVLPILRPDWRVLDLGCGPGTITVGLATRVPCGSVLGIDIHPGQIERARELGRARHLVNIAFEVGTIESLNLSDGTFDLIFAHAVFEHLGTPIESLSALRRFLKPAGCVAVRSPEWGGFVVHPETPYVDRALAAYEKLQRGNGGDLRSGRKLASWLARAGFSDIRRSASYEIYDRAEDIASYLAAQLERDGQPDAGAALRDWAREPEALFAQAWFEAIGCNAGANP
jgi:ubiquinone/menaquinone biosynthesis C-methylase UbiE